ncbi:MAG: Rne/Rng family ribonuclease [Dermatophilaceae bacterium]|jgi:ribonuclease E
MASTDDHTTTTELTPPPETTVAGTSAPEGTAEGATSAKAPARRSRRRTAAPAVQAQDEGTQTQDGIPAQSLATSGEPATELATSGEPADDPAPTTTPARRSRAAGTTTTTRRRAAKAAAPEQAVADLDALLAEPTPRVEEAEAAEEVEETAAAEAVVPSFGLVFQPPVPTFVAPRPAREPAAPAAPEHADASTEPGDEPDVEDSDEGEDGEPRRTSRRRRGGRGRRTRTGETPQGQSESGDEDEPSGSTDSAAPAEDDSDESSASSRRRRRRRRGSSAGESEDAPGVVTRVRESRPERSEVVGVRGSTRLEAKKQRRREGREAGRRRTVITEAEFLARRESVDRIMLVRQIADRTQIAVLEDGVLVEHYVSRDSTVSMAGNIYLGRVQNVLPSMEAAFVDIGKGRNAVLYAGEVNWDAAGMEANQPKRIENALASGENVLVQVTKDPIGHKGARLTSQISLPGRYLVYVPDSSMTGISRKLPDTERARLKRILKEVLPGSAGVIVRTAAEGASEEELRGDVERLTATWESIKAKAQTKAGKGRSGASPLLLHGEPDLTVRVIRDIFNEDFASLVVSGDSAYGEVREYVGSVAPDLADRIQHWTSEQDIFSQYRVHEQIAKAMDRKVWLPSGGSLVIDRTEAMTVIDVNTGKFVGSGGNLEETVTKNNLEAAEEIVRQLRLRDVGGIIVIDFIDMVLESNRDLVVRRLLECLGRDRTKHQVAEVTSLGLVQMTRKRVGSGLIEVFSEPCEHCRGRGLTIHGEPVDKAPAQEEPERPSGQQQPRTRGRRGRSGAEPIAVVAPPVNPGGPTPAQIAAAAHAAAVKSSGPTGDEAGGNGAAQGVEASDVHEVLEASDVAEVLEASDVAERTEVVQSPEVAESPEAVESPDVAETAEVETAPVTDEEPAPVDPTPEVSTQAASRGRGRRRRGRVVAPAGPPRPVGEPAVIVIGSADGAGGSGEDA